MYFNDQKINFELAMLSIFCSSNLRESQTWLNRSFALCQWTMSNFLKKHTLTFEYASLQTRTYYMYLFTISFASFDQMSDKWRICL